MFSDIWHLSTYQGRGQGQDGWVGAQLQHTMHEALPRTEVSLSLHPWHGGAPVHEAGTAHLEFSRESVISVKRLHLNLNTWGEQSSGTFLQPWTQIMKTDIRPSCSLWSFANCGAKIDQFNYVENSCILKLSHQFNVSNKRLVSSANLCLSRVEYH